jgi:hypothetical protein
LCREKIFPCLGRKITRVGNKITRVGNKITRVGNKIAIYKKIPLGVWGNCCIVALFYK